LSDQLLQLTTEQIVIFIDEIDTILSLPFKVDDFFALIRDCYNKRADDPIYKRLTFALLGVTTPADLIQDQRRTPFNIGHAIKLDGFQLHEAEPLKNGFISLTENPQAVLEAVLYWTNGQPFLTQKVCKLIRESSAEITPGNEVNWVAELVREKIINQWESKDNPEHLRTLRDRLLYCSTKNTGRLLGLYQQILQHQEIPADNSPEQMILRLTGLVVQTGGKLRVYNSVYRAVFNLNWIEEQLAKLRPYAEALNAWEKSARTDESRLLKGEALTEAKTWAIGKSLSDQDYQFFAASEQLDKREIQATLAAEKQANVILTKAKRRAFLISGISMGILGLSLGWGLSVNNSFQLSVSRILALSAEQLFNSEKELEALITALKAYKTMKGAIFADANTQKEVRTALQSVMYQIREKNRLIGHNNVVYNIHFSPDGELIASASGDKTIKLWKKDGTFLKTLTGHTDEILSINFSPDGQLMASASRDGIVKLWKLDGTLLHTLTEHQATVNNVTWSRDGQTLASASDDGTIKLWKLDGTLLKTIQDKGPISSVSLSQDGQTIASGSMDGTVKLWKKDGTFQKSFSAHNGLVVSVNFSPDGEIIASCSQDKTVKLWTPDGTLIKTLEHNAGVLRVYFSADSQMLVSSSIDNEIKVWKRDGTLLKTFTGRSANFSPDGQTLVFASLDHVIELWKWNNSLRETLKTPTDVVLGVSFSPNSQMLASASPENSAQLWKRDGTLLKTLPGHQNVVTSVSFSHDGQRVASGSWDTTVKLWKTDGTLLNTLSGHQGPVYSVSFSPDSQMLASASFDTTVKLWKPDGTLLHTLSGHRALVINVSFSRDGQTLASASIDGTVKLWKTDGTLLHTFSEHSAPVYSASFSPDSQTLASASADGIVKVWKPDGTLLKSWTGHNVAVNNISFSPDGSAIASVSDDQTVKFWKPDGTWLATLPSHTAPVRSLSFSPDNKTLASGGDDQTIILWNLEGLKVDGLLKHSCNWLQDYFNNSNVNLSQEDRRVCDGINSSGS
jgi:WD40 repeat protein